MFVIYLVFQERSLSTFASVRKILWNPLNIAWGCQFCVVMDTACLHERTTLTIPCLWLTLTTSTASVMTGTAATLPLHTKFPLLFCFRLSVLPHFAFTDCYDDYITWFYIFKESEQFVVSMVWSRLVKL